MGNWEENEGEKYSLLYEDGYPDGNPVRVAEWARLSKLDSVIDLGCGLGVLVDFFDNYTGVDVSNYVIERNIGSNNILRGNQYKDKRFSVCGLSNIHNSNIGLETYDVGICADVIEHIPPDFLNDVLYSISQLNCNTFVFSVSTRASKLLAKDGSNLHLTVMTYEEWIPLFEKYFDINFDKIWKGDQSFFIEMLRKK